MNGLRGCIFTLITFVWLFSAVYFQMSLQMACLSGCKVTLATSVCLFSAVFFQMSPQLACWSRCIFTLVAFVYLFAAVPFVECSLCHKDVPICIISSLHFQEFNHNEFFVVLCPIVFEYWGIFKIPEDFWIWREKKWKWNGERLDWMSQKPYLPHKTQQNSMQFTHFMELVRHN